MSGGGAGRRGPPARFWEDLAAFARRDPGGRGVGELARPSLEAVCRALLGVRSGLLLTGFVRLPEGAPETDGPLGTFLLGCALESLGADVHFVTDPPCREVLEELGALPLLVPDLDGSDDPARIEALFEMSGADLVLAVERPGPDAQGRLRNMRGGDLGGVHAPLHRLFEPREGVLRVALGDGGNELGMGSLEAAERARLVGSAEGGCVVPADHLVVAGTSDWAALLLLAGLSALSGEALLPPAEALEGGMEAMLEAGAVDGVTGEAGASTDGVPLAETLALRAELEALVRSSQ